MRTPETQDGVELARRIVGHAFDCRRAPLGVRQPLAGGSHLLLHALELIVVGVPQIHREAHLAGHHVARVGLDLHEPHRAAPVRLVAVRKRIDLGDDPGGGEQRILAQAHGRGSGVGVLAVDHHVVPAQPEGAHDDAEHLFLVLENRPLLDVRLEVGADGTAADLLRAGEADLVERLADRDAVEIGPLQHHVQRKRADEHPRAHHDRGEARALLVGPHRDLDRRFGLDAVIVQAAHHLQPGEDTVVAVELAARGLRVDVAAGDDRRQGVVPAGPAREDVAHGIDLDAAARLLAPADEEVAGLAVQLGEREPAHPALVGGADPGQLHQGIPQPLRLMETLIAAYLSLDSPLTDAGRGDVNSGSLPLAGEGWGWGCGLAARS